MVIETYGPPKVRNRFYGYGSSPFNHDLVDELKAPLTGTNIRALVEQEYSNLPDNGWPTFVVSLLSNRPRCFRQSLTTSRLTGRKNIKNLSVYMSVCLSICLYIYLSI